MTRITFPKTCGIGEVVQSVLACLTISVAFSGTTLFADEATDQWVTDFQIRMASASYDGKYLLAICGNIGEGVVDKEMMVLFDLDRRKKLKTVAMGRPKHFGIDNERIFLVPKDGKTLKVLNLKTFEEQANVELKETVLDMTLINKRRVGLLLSKGDVNAVAFFDKKSLKRDEHLEVNETFSGTLDVIPFGDSYYRTRTDLKSRDTDEHVCVVEPPMLQKFSTRQNPAPYPFPNRGDSRMSLSRVYPHRGAVMGRADGIAWGQARAASESGDSWRWRRDRRGKDEFVLTRNPDEVWTISRLAEDNPESSFQFLIFRKNDVVFISNQVQTYVPRKARNLNLFCFLREPISIMDTTKAATIQLKCKGGVGKKIWTGLSNSPHWWIDESTGLLTVDVPAMWAEHLAVASDPDSRYSIFDPKRTAAEFKRITGKAVPEGKSAFCIPVDFRIEDSKLQRVKASVYLLVLAPSADYEIAKSVTPLTKGVEGLVSDAFAAMNQLKESATRAKAESGPATLDQRIDQAQEKANEIKIRLGRIESLIIQIRSLEKERE